MEHEQHLRHPILFAGDTELLGVLNSLCKILQLLLLLGALFCSVPGISRRKKSKHVQLLEWAPYEPYPIFPANIVFDALDMALHFRERAGLKLIGTGSF